MVWGTELRDFKDSCDEWFSRLYENYLSLIRMSLLIPGSEVVFGLQRENNFRCLRDKFEGKIVPPTPSLPNVQFYLVSVDDPRNLPCIGMQPFS